MLFTAVGMAVIARANAQKPVITVLAYDHAGLSDETRLRAEQQAARIFSQAGIDLHWRNCLQRGREPDSTGDSCVGLDASTPLFSLVRRFRSCLRVDGDAMGFTAGSQAMVSIDSAEFLSRIYGGPLWRSMGYIMAHELGHILLGAHAHSVSGIMLARWGSKEWMRMSQSSLYFLPEQARLLRERSADH